MTWALELWVEGPTDAMEATGAEGSDQAGALPALVQRTLRERSRLPDDAYERVVSPDVTVKWLKDRLRSAVALPGVRARGLSGWVRKVLVALSNARSEDPSTIIFLIRDCDGVPERLKERDRANDVMCEHGDSGRLVAVCVQAVEAWLLADAGAFRRYFGRGPERGVPGRPETVGDPKSVLRGLIAELRGSEDDDRWSTVYAGLAREVDLGMLSDSCAAGYQVFCKDVDRLIIPLLSH